VILCIRCELARPPEGPARGDDDGTVPVRTQVEYEIQGQRESLRSRPARRYLSTAWLAHVAQCSSRSGRASGDEVSGLARCDVLKRHHAAATRLDQDVGRPSAPEFGQPDAAEMSHPGGCSCCADAFVDDGIFGSEDLNQYIVRLHPPPRAHAFMYGVHRRGRPLARDGPSRSARV
jgi:hypothetical protein